MKIEPTGIVLVDVCSIQTDKCVAKQPAPITAIWTLPGRMQVDVCNACLEEQIRSGVWEIQGAKIKRRADVVVYSPDKKPQLIVEVKRKPIDKRSLREWAISIHRNLILHSGVPSSPYFLIAILPGCLYLWKDNDSLSVDKAPDYEIDAQEVLQPYLNPLSLSMENSSEYDLEMLITSWLKDLVSSKQPWYPAQNWLSNSGLLSAITNGSVVMQASIAA